MNKKTIGQLFEEAFNAISEEKETHIPKEIRQLAMQEAIKEAKTDIKKRITEQGNVVFAEFTVEPQCTCGCCHVIVKAEFITNKFTPLGIKQIEGEITANVIMA